MKEMVQDLRAKAGDRADQIEIAMNLGVVGDEVPPWMRQFLTVDPATMAEHDSMVLLRGSVQEMADELQRRRDDFGVSYVSISAGFSEQLAPVVEKLNGR
jgi:hypothetical protein